MTGHGGWMGGVPYVVACKMMPAESVSNELRIRFL